MPIEIEIEKIAFGGEGIGRLDGKVCLVDGALPGERVEIKIRRNKANFFKAELVRVLKKSDKRVEAPCAYYARCGGCQYQHMTYAAELEAKQSQINDFFLKRLKIPQEKIRKIEVSPTEYRYRNSVTLHPTLEDPKKAQALGLVAKDNESVLAVQDCLLADERLKPVFSSKFINRDRKKSFTFRLSGKHEVIADEKELFYEISIGAERLLVHSQGFFQNNLAVTQKIAACVGDYLKKQKWDSFFDLYAGVGTFTFLCASGIPALYAFEESPASMAALRMNLAEKNLKAMCVMEGRVEDTFTSFFKADAHGRSLVLMDPPRQGLDKKMAEFLSQQPKFGTIFYLSCDPATLVRDLEILTKRGNWQIQEVRPFDMFPRTKHIEVLVRLA